MLNICHAVCLFSLFCSHISQGRYCLFPTVCCRWATSNTWCGHTGRTKVHPLKAVFYIPSAGIDCEHQSEVRVLGDFFSSLHFENTLSFSPCVLWSVSSWVCFNTKKHLIFQRNINLLKIDLVAWLPKLFFAFMNHNTRSSAVTRAGFGCFL